MLSELLLCVASVCVLSELLLLRVAFFVIDQLQCALTELLPCVAFIAASSSFHSCCTSDMDENKMCTHCQELMTS